MSALRKRDIVISKCDGKSSGPYITSCKKTYVDKHLAIKMFNKARPGMLITGSKKCFVENRPAGRMKDKVICGRNITGSLKVFYG